MACLIPSKARGSWLVQWHNGTKWVRVTVVRRRPGWKPGDPMPKKPPAEALAALLAYQKREAALRLNRPADPDETVEAFLASYREAYATKRRATSVVQLDLAVRLFLEFCRAAKVTRLDGVTHDLADRYVTHRARAKMSHATVRKEVALLAAAWSRAVKLRRLGDNPWKGVEVPGEPKVRKSAWTSEEYQRLLAACRPWLRDLITLGCHTGLRASALTRLEWRDVRWSQEGEKGYGVITVRPELDKARAGYSLPMARGCHDLLFRLSAARGRGAHPFVLSGASGRPVKSIRALADAVHRACRRAGLPRPDAPNHAMRRTFGRWAVLGVLTGRPIPVYVVSRWLGHHSIRQTQVYLDLREADSQDWMAEAPGPE